MNLDEVKIYLKENVIKENDEYFGFTDVNKIEQITNNWFNDAKNYDGRWSIITNRLRETGKVLDMAAGCGTFVLNGLQNGHDVYGVEPADWKLIYFNKKIQASNYPHQWTSRIINAVGEALPYEDGSFDLITSYQTLEHVQNVKGCIQEMLRVLKTGGVLYIRAPDYNCFFEPHYRVPFLPKMNKVLAAKYLKIIGRPILGLENLTWITEREIARYLDTSGYRLTIKSADEFYFESRKLKILSILPSGLKSKHVVNFLNGCYVITTKVVGLLMIGRREKNIDLWITKV